MLLGGVILNGLFGSIPWIDTEYCLHVLRWCRFGNPGMAFRVRGGNSMTFVSGNGFTPRAGAALDPNTWEE